LGGQLKSKNEFESSQSKEKGNLDDAPQHTHTHTHTQTYYTHLQRRPGHIVRFFVTDAQGPESNVSDGCNYPQCPSAVWEE